MGPLGCISASKSSKLDCWGLCPAALFIVLRGAPHWFEEACAQLCQDSNAWHSMEFVGTAFAKSKGCVTSDKVRSIVPIPSIPKFIDRELAWCLNGVADYITDGLNVGFMETAKTGRQLLDVGFSCRLLVERGLDNHSRACVAQADIAKYYDHLSAILVSRFCEDFTGASSNDTIIDRTVGSMIDVGATLVMLHNLPTISLRVGSAEAQNAVQSCRHAHRKQLLRRRWAFPTITFSLQYPTATFSLQ